MRSKRNGGIERSVATAVASMAFVALLGGAGAQAEEYRLSVSDRLRLKVVEFNQNSLVPNEWAVMGGDYGVNGEGDIVLPIVGSVPAAGLTVPDLNKAIVRGVRGAIGLTPEKADQISITASLEVVEYGPVYVSGDVQQPGAYAFRPGMTVLKALSLAGGLPRQSAATAGWSMERETINARGSLREAGDAMAALAGRQARLQAERTGAEAIAFAFAPEAAGAEKIDPETLRRVKENETAIFQERSGEIRRQVEALDRQRALLESEFESLQQQVKAQVRQADLIRKDLKDVSSLVDRGLSVTSRRLTLERALADVESRGLQFQTAAIQVQQDINKSERERASLVDKRRIDVSTELAEVQREIDAAREKQDTARAILAQLALTGSTMAQAQAAAPVIQSYRLVRRNDADGTVDERIVDEAANVMPGDTIKVALGIGPLSGGGEGPASEEGAGAPQRDTAAAIAP